MKKIKLLAIIISISSAILWFNAATAKSTTHALVIGIGTYNDPNISSLSTQPINDAKSIKKLIETHFDGEKKIKLLLNKDATKANILNSLERLSHEVRAGDSVIFYYSGHGDRVKNDNPEVDKEEDGLDEIIVNVDAVRNIADPIKNIIRDDDLEKKFSAIEAKGVYVLVIMDSCHSGSIGKSSSYHRLNQDKKPKIEPLVSQLTKANYQKLRDEKVLIRSTDSRTILTATSADQVSFIETSMSGSIFTLLLTQAINKGLADINQNGSISYGELHSYLFDASAKYCFRKKKKEEEECEDGLTPVLEIYDGYLSQPFTKIPQMHPKAPNTANEVYTILEETFAQHLTNNIKLAIKHPNEPKPLTLGEELFVEIQSDIKGHLILLDVNAKGEMIQIFPNGIEANDEIKAGKKYYFPTNIQQNYGFYASEKGKSRLYAIITQDPINLKGTVKKDLEATPIKNPAEYAGGLANKLNAPWTGDEVTRLSRYSVSALDYTVH